MKRIPVISSLLFLILTVFHCTNREDAPLPANLESAKYTLEEDGQSFSVTNEPVILKFTGNQGDVYFVESNTEFNRAIKRDPAILVTGDKPRFALMLTNRVRSAGPDLVKLGDGRIKIESNGSSKWIDEMSDIFTVFHPGRTEYIITDSTLTGIKLKYVVSQAENWGAIGQLTVSNRSSDNGDVKVKFVYGGLRRCGRTFRAAYFTADENDGEGDKIIIENDEAYFVDQDDNISEVASVSFFPKQKMEIENHKVSASYDLSLETGKEEVLYIKAGFAESKEELAANTIKWTPESLMAESKAYYENLIDPFTISTPSEILDAGFRTAIYSLDYVYAEPAWLEGIHWWSCYWANLFQMSAATSINQTERTKGALRYFNQPESGPASPLFADGYPFDTKTGEDGLLYYIYSLHQYYEHTGDVDLIKEVWPGVIKAFELLEKNRDPDNNKLLNWHFGSNAFLYQSDMLQLTGDAASPSLIYSGSMELASELATVVGDKKHADEFKKSSQQSLAAANDNLWSTADGCYYSHVDLQNIKHNSHYYTDMVYPALYTSASDLKKWQSLEFLKNTLFLDAEIAKPNTQLQLMKVGNLKSPLFGNDNVMPAQMTEAARAFFAMGQNKTGFDLLESVALSSTIFTEAPGNFPERLSFDGKGEANYNFGNPIGSYLYSVVRGLFGLSLSNEGNTLEWMPAFPAEWEHAEIALPYASVNYKKSGNKLIFTAEYPKAKELNYTVFIDPGTIKSVELNGKPVEYIVSEGIGRMHLKLSAPAELRHQITISYEPKSIEIKGPEIVYQHTEQKWELNHVIEKVLDPQNMLRNVKTGEKDFTAEIGETKSFISKHQVFIKLKDIPVVYPLELEVLPEYSIACDTAWYQAEEKQVNLEVSYLAPTLLSKSTLRVYTMGNQAEIDLLPSGEENQSLNLSFPGIEILPEGCYRAVFQVIQNELVVFEDTSNIVLSGMDSTTHKAMTTLRDQNTDQIDISQHLNTNKIHGDTRWRQYAVIEIKKNLFSKDTSWLSTPLGNFNISPDSKFIAMAQLGKSEHFSCETLSVPYSNSLTVDVQKKSQMISLLFVNESQCRNTWAEVGSITLNYEDGQKTVVPLVMGENVESFDLSFASNTYSIPYENHRDHLNIGRIPCDADQVLTSITIEIVAADFQFGLIGLNYLKSINDDPE
ncbi:MAG: GH116 family glycosyl hydrolase [Bacteroidota bacterium]